MLSSGCAQSGPLLSKGTNVGTLKTSLSHLEYENRQLRGEITSLKSELRQTEDRLVQEESANGELKSDLNNATAMLKRKGLDGGDLADSGSADAGPERPRTTLPAGRSGRKLRKPPSAQIPGRIETLPRSPEDLDTSSTSWGPRGSRPGDDPEAGVRSDNVVWLPVARGVTDSSAARR